MKFSYNTKLSLPKQSKRSRSVLQDGSRSLGLFWKKKTLSYNRRNTVACLLMYRKSYCTASGIGVGIGVSIRGGVGDSRMLKFYNYSRTSKAQTPLGL